MELIRQYDPGAQPASGAAAWTPELDSLYVETGRSGWTFHFYLPTNREMATVIVDRGGSARVTALHSWATPPRLLDIQGWTVDSGQAMGLFLEVCQPILGSQPDLDVQMRLSTAADAGRLTWLMEVIAPDEQALCEVSVDASTGQLR